MHSKRNETQSSKVDGMPTSCQVAMTSSRVADKFRLEVVMTSKSHEVTSSRAKPSHRNTTSPDSTKLTTNMQFFTLANFFCALAAMAVVGSASPTPVRAELSLRSQYTDRIPGACSCCLHMDRRRIRPLAHHHRRRDHPLWEHHPQPARSPRHVEHQVHQGHIL